MKLSSLLKKFLTNQMAFGLNFTNVRQPTVAMCPLVMSLYYVFIIITSTVMIVCSSLTNNKWY